MVVLALVVATLLFYAPEDTEPGTAPGQAPDAGPHPGSTGETAPPATA
jgi:hypothetical protein